MDRRSVLKTVSILVGGAMSGGTIATIMSGCQPNTSDGYQTFIFNNQEMNVLAEIVETILPATDTPGAKELMVHRFIDEALSKNYDETNQTKIKGTLAAINDECDKLHQKLFIDASTEERLSAISVLDKASFEMKDQEEKHFFHEFKSLVLAGFFSTEVGQTQVLQHVAIPGKYEPCIPVNEAGNGKTWAQG
jgi:hypothetical protein